MNKNEIEIALMHSLNQLLLKDKYLLEKEVNERSITHKLASYLQFIIGNRYDVDCEYNKNIQHISNSKKLDILKERLQEIGMADRGIKLDEYFQEITVYPDIIIHKRGQNDLNLLVIEVKRSSNTFSRDFDLLKLEHYTHQTDNRTKLHYTFGVFIDIGTGDKTGLIKFVWFEDGRVSGENCVSWQPNTLEFITVNNSVD